MNFMDAYGNERSVGRAIKDSGIPREEIWVELILSLLLHLIYLDVEEI